MQKPEKKALDFYRRQNYSAALKAFFKLDESILKRGDILVLIANCYDALGQKKSAVDYYKKALKVQKKSETAAANLAIIYYELKKIFQAKRYANKALKINPQNVSALVVWGNICYCAKNYPKALHYYQRALEQQRDFYTANFNTAGIYFEMKDYPTAYFYARRTVQLYPQAQEAMALLANICMELDKNDEAVEILAQLYAKNPRDYWVCNSISQAFQRCGRYDEALEMGWRAVLLSKGENAQQINFGYLLYETAIESSAPDVKKYARKWLQKYPDSPVVRHMGNAIVNAESVSQINSLFVREIFDAFADDFEEVLHNLDYSVPSRMSEEMDSLFANLHLKKMKILDIGCGTGLCGHYLKRYAKFRGLDGVDISAKMLEVAARKKLYTHLYNEDIKQFLSSRSAAYDLINAADVFTYFGELNSLFILLYQALRKNGRILFSVSENYENDRDWFLHASGRFLHSRKYIETSLIRQGFFIEKINRVRLRNEGDKAVYGWIVMAQKQG